MLKVPGVRRTLPRSTRPQLAQVRLTSLPSGYQIPSPKFPFPSPPPIFSSVYLDTIFPNITEALKTLRKGSQRRNGRHVLPVLDYCLLIFFTTDLNDKL